MKFNVEKMQTDGINVEQRCGVLKKKKKKMWGVNIENVEIWPYFPKLIHSTLVCFSTFDNILWPFSHFRP